MTRGPGYASSMVLKRKLEMERRYQAYAAYFVSAKIHLGLRGMYVDSLWSLLADDEKVCRIYLEIFYVVRWQNEIRVMYIAWLLS